MASKQNLSYFEPIFGQKHVSTRDLADFFDHYKSAAALTRERMAAEPSLFLKAMRTQKEKKEAERLRAGPEGKWLL